MQKTPKEDYVITNYKEGKEVIVVVLHKTAR